MDILIAIVAVVLAIYADKKKKQKRDQRGTARPYQQSVIRSNQQSVIRPSQPNAGRQNMPGQMANTLQTASNVMQKNMTQTQRELKERLQKKYGNVMQQEGRQQEVQPRKSREYEQRRPGQQAAVKGQQNDILSRATANVQEDAVDELRFERKQEMAANTLELGMVETSELMQQISDLMITGYAGELSFERDFVAEGVEMLNRCEATEF